MPIHESRLWNCIVNAARFLNQNQLSYGGFRSYIADNETMQGGCTLESSIFATSCILYSLQFLDSPEMTSTKDTACEFLIEEMTSPGIWRYWSSRFPMPIDPDLDCTALASFVLRDLHPDISAGRNIDALVGNRNKDDLFFTWLRQAGDANDVDSVVNANVLLYLGETGETRVVCDYLNTVIAEHGEPASYYYYLDDLALYHAVSRAYFNGVTSLEAGKEAIISRIANTRQQDGSWGNELLTALALCTLLNYRCDGLGFLIRSVESLMDTQRGDGAWPRRAFYAGPPPPGPYAAWFGSEELTTALCLEALARYQALAAGK